MRRVFLFSCAIFSTFAILQSTDIGLNRPLGVPLSYFSFPNFDVNRFPRLIQAELDKQVMTTEDESSESDVEAVDKEAKTHKRCWLGFRRPFGAPAFFAAGTFNGVSTGGFQPGGGAFGDPGLGGGPPGIAADGVVAEGGIVDGGMRREDRRAIGYGLRRRRPRMRTFQPASISSHMSSTNQAIME